MKKVKKITMKFIITDNYEEFAKEKQEQIDNRVYYKFENG